MSIPRVSVLMTAYNVEKHLAIAIESVLNSTFEDLELIITDDQSSDQSIAIAREWAGKDSRVKVHINEKNLGDYPNRNRAASHAQGEYLKYVDADDYLYPNGLKILVEMIDQFPDAGYGLCSLDQDYDRPYPFLLSPREAYQRHYFRSPIFHKAPLSSIIRRSAWETVGGFPEARMIGDTEMWHNMSRVFDVVLMPYGPVWYREHEGQETAKRTCGSTDDDILYERVVQRALVHTDCPLNPDEKSKVTHRYYTRNMRQAIKSLIKCRLRDAIKRAKHAWSFARLF
jgi:glycosyltransferase involved in cell wall biosynthesis